MYIASQFSVFLVNKPGILASVCAELGRAKVNIVALTMMDSSEHGVLRLVVEHEDECREILARLNLPTTETDVLVVPVPNKPGAMADVAGKLAAEHINISYAYATQGTPKGRALSILKVADMKKAQKVLGQQPKRSRDLGTRGRRPAR